MRISDLSARSGVSVATLKYYLREGLLPPGQSTGATAATYDEGHLQRVRLIRALVESARLSIAGVRKVVAALDAPPTSRHELLGVAAYALDGASADDAEAEGAVDRLLDTLGWTVSDAAPARRRLAAAVGAARAAGLDHSESALVAYAEAMHRVAELDVASVPRDSAEAALRHVVVGTVLLDPVLIALRRLAQEDVSSRLG